MYTQYSLFSYSANLYGDLTVVNLNIYHLSWLSATRDMIKNMEISKKLS